MRNKTEIVKRKYNRYSIFFDISEYLPEKWFFSKWRKRIISSLKGKVLEVGVGTGKNLKYYSKDVNVTGVDISPGMLNRAIKESKKIKRNFSLIQMDAENLKFKDNSFDTIVCTFVFCSVPDPVKGLEEIRRVCKSNGKIVMMEHVLSKNKLVAFLQHVHNPIMRFLFGVNINRDTILNIKKAGLKIVNEENLASNDIFKFVVCDPNKK